jgi:hypothetical protein
LHWGLLVEPVSRVQASSAGGRGRVTAPPGP